MSYTYNPALNDNTSLVRFHTGDTSSEGYYLEDETISALLTSEGSIGAAVIACIKYIITQLSSPNFRQDWLTVDNKTAREGFEGLLKIKAQEFGISLSSGISTTATIGLPYRRDSYQYTDQTRTDDTDTNTGSYSGSP